MFERWYKPLKRRGAYVEKDIIKKLRKEKKINDSFLISLGSLTLEELIAIKLELSFFSTGPRRKLINFPIWKKLPKLVTAAIVTYFVSISNTRADLQSLLCLNNMDVSFIEKKYKVDKYFGYKAHYISEIDIIRNKLRKKSKTWLDLVKI